MKKKKLKEEIDNLNNICESLLLEVEALKKCHGIDANDRTLVYRNKHIVEMPAYTHEEQSGYTEKAGIVNFTELAKLVIDGKKIDLYCTQKKKIGIHTEGSDE